MLYPQYRITSVKVASPSILESIKFEDLPEDVIRACLSPRWFSSGNVLDTAKIPKELAKWEKTQAITAQRPIVPMPAVRVSITDAAVLVINQILDAIAKAQATFRQIASQPGASDDAVFQAIDDQKEQLGCLNVVIFRPLDDAGARWVSTQRTRQWTDEPSRYDPSGGGAEPEGVLRSVIEAEGDIFDVDISDPASFERAGIAYDATTMNIYREHSTGPNRMLYIKMKDSSGKPIGVVLLHNRVKNDEELVPPPLLPEKVEDAQRIITALRLYFAEAARAVAPIKKGTSPAEIVSSGIPKAPEGFDLFRKLQSVCVFSRFGRYRLAAIENPSSWEAAEQAGLVEAFSWMGRGWEDMRAHVVAVNELSIAFDQEGKAVAFASIDELPYIDTSFTGRRRNARIAPLVGTAVREDHRGRHLEVELNAKLLIRRWLRYKMTYGWLTPFRLGTRTKNPIVVASLYRYFTNVKYKKLTAAEIAARKVLLEYFQCGCDEDGKVSGIYEQPLPPERREMKMSKRMKRRVDTALAGLTPKDARIFVFELTLFTLIQSVSYKLFKNTMRRIIK